VGFGLLWRGKLSGSESVFEAVVSDFKPFRRASDFQKAIRPSFICLLFNCVIMSLDHTLGGDDVGREHPPPPHLSRPLGDIYSTFPKLL